MVPSRYVTLMESDELPERETAKFDIAQAEIVTRDRPRLTPRQEPALASSKGAVAGSPASSATGRAAAIAFST